MKQYRCNDIVLYLTLALTSVLTVGCIVCSNDVHYSGVEDSKLREIEPGQTTIEQLIENLGEPTEQYTDEKGSEILRYRCTKRTENEFVMIPPVIVTEENRTSEHMVAFEVRDGIVRRYWKER